MGIVFAVASLLCLLFNSLVLLAFFRDPLKKFRKLFNFLLIHLCFCDLLAGMVCFPITSYGSFAFTDEKFLDVFTNVNYVALPLLNAGFYTTVTLSYDRYRAITKPIEYRQIADSKHFVCYTAFVWIVSLVLAAVFFSFKTITESLIMNFVICFTVPIFLVVMLIRVHRVLGSNSGDTVTDVLLSTEASQTRLMNERRALTTCKLIFLLQLLTILSVLAADIYIEVNNNKKRTLSEQVLLKYIFFLPLLFSKIGNPLICIFRMTDFKDSLKALFTFTSERRE